MPNLHPDRRTLVMIATPKSHIRLALVAGWQCRVWTNSRGETFVLNRIAPAGHCIRP